MLQVEQILQNRYRLQRQIGNNGVRQTWLATDLQASAQENSQVIVKEEILGWNWGAFLMPWFWLWTNQVWVGLLCFLPSIGWVMTIILGVNGNEWAWKSRRWRSVQHFKEHQRGWAIAGMLIGAPFSIILWMAAIAFLTSFL